MTPDHLHFHNRIRPGDGDPPPHERVRTVALRAANLLIVVLSIVAMVSLIAEHGFYLTEEWRTYAHLATKVVLYGFLVHLLLVSGFSGERLDYLSAHRIELAIGVLIVLHLALPGTMTTIIRALDPAVAPEFLARVYVILMQVMLVLALIPSAVRFSTRAMGTSIQPSSLIAIAFLAAILLGAGLLLLPRATGASPIAPIDAFFTSASAVCVTGLTVVDTATSFTRTGHVILLFLIQIGGLGIMTLTTFFAFMVGGRGSLKQYSTLQSLLGADSIGRIRGVVLRIGMTTLLIEAAGAVSIWFSLGDTMSASPRDRAFFAIFHSVSAFCNAGFTLTTDNLAAGPLHANPFFLSSIMMLIVLGGLGFPVLLNLAQLLPRRKVSTYRRRLSLHTLLVLIATGTLILLGTVVFFLLERDRWLAGLPPLEQLFTALFHSISARTAGFNTLPMQSLGPASLLFLIMLMWIGASPGSTGGGVKTTTVVVALLAIRSIVTGRESIEAFRNRIPNRALLQAFSTIALSMGVIGLALFTLLLFESMPFRFLFFEVVSAFGTVGLSADVTAHLSVAGKIVITAVIFIGRVGVLSFLLALSGRRKEQPYEYTEEPVHIT